MAYVEWLECDRCGARAAPVEAAEWYEVFGFLEDDPDLALHFCSWFCVAGYAKAYAYPPLPAVGTDPEDESA